MEEQKNSKNSSLENDELHDNFKSNYSMANGFCYGKYVIIVNHQKWIIGVKMSWDMKLSDKLNKKFAGKLLWTTYTGRNWLGAKLTGDACGHRQLKSMLSRDCCALYVRHGMYHQTKIIVSENLKNTRGKSTEKYSLWMSSCRPVLCTQFRSRWLPMPSNRLHTYFSCAVHFMYRFFQLCTSNLK